MKSKNLTARTLVHAALHSRSAQINVGRDAGVPEVTGDVALGRREVSHGLAPRAGVRYGAGRGDIGGSGAGAAAPLPHPDPLGAPLARPAAAAGRLDAGPRRRVAGCRHVASLVGSRRRVDVAAT